MSAVPPNETERLAELHRYEILDSGPEHLFDSIVALAADLLQVPIALISLVDRDRVWFKARCGLDVQEVERDKSICAHAILGDDLFSISDLQQDERTQNHRLVAGPPFARFYAGMPILSRHNYKLGVLCILDTKSRVLSEKERNDLRMLSTMISAQLEWRRAARQIDRTPLPNFVPSVSPDESLRQERQIFMGGPTVVFKWRAAEGWPVEYVSPSVEQFGYSAEELMSGEIPFTQLVHPDDLKRVAAEVSAYSNAGVECFNQEYRLCRRDGTIRWAYDFTVIVRDANRKITHFNGYLMDTTERKRAEESVRDSQAKYQAMVDSFDGLIYICSSDYKIEFMNRKLIERTGYNAIGDDCFRALHKRDSICPWCVNENILRGKTVRWEVLSPKDNRWYYVVNTPIHHSDGRISKMAMIHDVTERKLAEETLKRREAILEAIGFASEQLMNVSNWSQCIQGILAHLGQAVDVSRVYMMENTSTGSDGAVTSSRRYEWTAAGVASQVYDPLLQNLALRTNGLARWEDTLSRGGTIEGHVREFPESERSLLRPHNILSLIAVPIFVDKGWWGFLGFDSCIAERSWSPVEVEALKTAAGLLGAAIQHRASEEALRKSEERHRVLLNAIPDIVFRLNKDGIFLDFKAEKDSDLNVGPGEIVGRTLHDVLPTDVANQGMVHIRRALERGERQLYEYELTIGGRSRTFEARIDVSGKDEVVAIIRDVGERKEAAAQVSKLSRAADQTADAVMITDSLHVIEYVNPAFEKLLGYSRDEVLGKTPDVLRSGLQDAGLIRGIEQNLERGEVVRFVFQNRRKNGTIYYQSDTITPIKDSGGRITHYVSTGRDISERVASEEALKASEQRLADIISFLPDATFAIDNMGKVIAWNRAMETLSGVRAADILGHSDFEYALPFYRARRPLLADLVTKGNPDIEKEYKYIERVGDTLIAEVSLPHLHGGLFVWVKASPLYDAQGNIVGAIECIRDITDKKRSEESIRKLAAFPQFNPNPVLEFTADGTLSYFNRAAKEMAVSFGRENPLEILPPDSADIVRQCLAANESRLRVEMRVGDRTLSWSYFPILENSTVHAYGGDITERVNMEAQVRHLQKMDAVGRLAGGVAHDFNNILTAILGYSSMLLLEKNLEPGVMEQLKEISKAAERASRLTRQLLTFSRKQVIQPKVLNINDILSNLKAMLRSLISEDVSMDLHLQPDLPLLYVDQTMIEQVLVNLVINARDAMPQGGALTIATSAVEIGDSQARGNPEAKPGRFVRLSVSDTGIGISKDLQAQIFEPFFTTKPSGKGTGLGLATVYGIIKQHNGWIEVESEEERGSTFNVFLPVSEGVAAPAPAAEKKHSPLPVPGGTETILVVEDEPTVRVLACSVLSQYGYKVIEASSGADGLATWEKVRGRVDLLLTDIVMPGGMTGSDLADQLTQRKKGLRVLLTSGYRVDSLGQRAPHRKDYRFLPKPFSPEDLARKVRQCLDGK